MKPIQHSRRLAGVPARLAGLADHPDRRRGRPARGGGGGARGPGAGQPPAGGDRGRLNQANEAAQASDSMTTVVLAPLTR